MIRRRRGNKRTGANDGEGEGRINKGRGRRGISARAGAVVTARDRCNTPYRWLWHRARQTAGNKGAEGGPRRWHCWGGEEGMRGMALLEGERGGERARNTDKK